MLPLAGRSHMTLARTAQAAHGDPFWIPSKVRGVRLLLVIWRLSRNSEQRRGEYLAQGNLKVWLGMARRRLLGNGYRSNCVKSYQAPIHTRMGMNF